MDARDKILETATRLFSTQGFGSTSLSQVAKEARVSKALIFWHFENKERLFQSALQRSLEPYFVNVVGQLDGLDEAAQIHRLIDLFYDFVREHMQSIRFVLSLILREEKQPDDPVARVAELFRIFRNLLNDILENGRQKGVFRADIDAASEASLMMCALAGALVQRFIGSDFSGESEVVVSHLKIALLERLLVPNR
jgi:TetR/AcrR family transcriptional regulator, transcriptional repressor for nem operon